MVESKFLKETIDKLSKDKKEKKAPSEIFHKDLDDIANLYYSEGPTDVGFESYNGDEEGYDEDEITPDERPSGDPFLSTSISSDNTVLRKRRRMNKEEWVSFVASDTFSSKPMPSKPTKNVSESEINFNSPKEVTDFRNLNFNYKGELSLHDAYKDFVSKYFKGDTLARDVFLSKYAKGELSLYGRSGLETPDLMHKRLADEFARIEVKFGGKNQMDSDEIFELLKDFKYILPGGSILYGTGADDRMTSLSNCFVVGNEDDSYGGILLTEEEQIHIMKRRGGVGIDLSHIRAKGSSIDNAALTSTGIVPFMERYSNSTREVAQDGRRGALMLSLNAEHSDALDFIRAKTDLSKITGANISLKVSDNFMANSGVYNKLNVAEIAKSIHKTAEPGIFFWDKIIKESPADCYSDDGFKTVSTNPCGEIPLSPYDACRLLAINLFAYVDDPFTDKAKFNYPLFSIHTKQAQRLLDDVIELELEKIEKILSKIKSDKENIASKQTEYSLWRKIKKATTSGRRTGLGVTGFADMFAALGIKYGDELSQILITDIFKEFSAASYASSIEMAEERGSFPVFNRLKEKNNPFISRVINSINESAFIDNNIIKKYHSFGRRNIANLTIAPTGSISILAGVSSGIENVFQLSYLRRRKVDSDYKGEYEVTVDNVGDHWITYRVIHKNFALWMEINGHMTKRFHEFTDKEINDLYLKSPYAGTVVKDIDPIAKVKLQGIVQKYIDHSISNTTNLPSSATVKDVKETIYAAFEAGCKGITIYVDGSRDGVLINKEVKTINKGKRGQMLNCLLDRENIQGRDSLIITGIKDNDPYEVFVIDLLKLGEKVNTERREHGVVELVLDEIVKRLIRDSSHIKKIGKGVYDLLSKKGKLIIHDITSYTIQEDGKFSTRLISLMLRKGVMPDEFIKQIDKSDENITHLYKVLTRVLKKRYNSDKTAIDKCPECGEEMVSEGGCSTCYNCGYSKCG